MFNDTTVKVAYSKTTKEERRQKQSSYNKRRSYRVIVENIDPQASWQDLKDLMRKEGDVARADVIRSPNDTYG